VVHDRAQRREALRQEVLERDATGFALGLLPHGALIRARGGAELVHARAVGQAVEVRRDVGDGGARGLDQGRELRHRVRVFRGRSAARQWAVRVQEEVR
jgi:hypothetical protein